MNFTWNCQNTSCSWQTFLCIHLHWHILQAVQCAGWNNCSFSKQLLSRMDVLFLMSIFRLHPGVKLSFELNRARKNVLLSACFCWESRLSLRQMDQKFKFGGTIGYGESYLEFYFVNSKYLDYMRYYMMLMEQLEHIMAKNLVTVTWLDKDQIHVCLVMWLDYFSAFA